MEWESSCNAAHDAHGDGRICLALWRLEDIGDDNRYLVHASSFEQSFELGVVEKEGLWITGSLSLPLCITARSEVSGVACQDEGGRARGELLAMGCVRELISDCTLLE